MSTELKKEICLAGGCFWGMEKLFLSFNGILDTCVGYANIRCAELADYKTVRTGTTEARESVKISYDPAVLPLTVILELFFAVIDPTVKDMQGEDIGSQYQTGIYWIDPEDEAVILDFAGKEAGKYPVFCTELKELKNFYPAEEYHQHYLEKNPGGYCHISPGKIAELRKKYGK